MNQTMLQQRLNVDPDVIAEFCRKHHISRLAFFGSVLRDDFNPESDIDVLVDFEPGHIPGMMAIIGMELEFSEFMNGRKVDLRTAKDLSRYFRAEVVATADVWYDAA
ncbi:MAG TPA: nucleotidyltransferase family protein [Longimicrobiaceae bacterium]|jgi:predicted nucleotidyltransferase|nr:nucleotidyltransferase family protein [Longimicrobiaceae bacterium]